ncbi:MAG: DUF4160 domain-containing protein [Candidatus Eisenbacteria bacterium]
MPVISEFFGIRIRMYYLDHEPAHFHVEYGGAHCTYQLDGAPLAGLLPSGRAERLVQRWARKHRFELEANWQRILAGRPIRPIAPLE